MSISSSIKSIQDIMRKDVGVDGDSTKASLGFGGGKSWWSIPVKSRPVGSLRNEYNATKPVGPFGSGTGPDLRSQLDHWGMIRRGQEEQVD